MAPLSLPESRLYGVLYESILYGINVILLLTLLCIFAQQKKLSNMQRTGTATICTIFLLCTVHQVAAVHSIGLGFFYGVSANRFFNDRSQAIILVQNVAYTFALVLADALMIHRLYIIFNRSWKVIIVPGLLLMSTTAVSVGLIRAYATSPPESTLWSPSIARFAPACLTLSFLTNLLITLLVIIRLLRAIRSTRHLVVGDRLTFDRRFLACTVESGLFYPISVFVTCVLYFMRSNAVEILSGANIQLLCIVPMMLTLQMRLNLSVYETGRGLRSLPSSLNMADAPVQFARLSAADGGLSSLASTLRTDAGEVPIVFPPTRPALVLASTREYDTKRMSPLSSPTTPTWNAKFADDATGSMKQAQAFSSAGPSGTWCRPP